MDLLSRRGWIIGLLIVSVLLGWWWFAVRIRMNYRPEKPVIHRTDLTVFTTAGLAFVDGDPATEPYDSPNVRGWHYNYPPLFAIVMSPLGKVHPHVASGVWFVLNLGLCVGIGREGWKMIRGLWPPPGDALQWTDSSRREPPPPLPAEVPGFVVVFAVLMGVLPALNCLQRGQVGLLLTYLALLGIRLGTVRPTAGKAWACGVVLALAAVLKVFPALPMVVMLTLAWLAMPRRVAVGITGGVAVGLAVFLLVLPGVLVGWGENAGYLQTWWTRVVTNPDLAIETDFNLRSVRNQSLENAALLAGSRLGLLSEPLPARAMMGSPGWLSVRCAVGGVMAVGAWGMSRRRCGDKRGDALGVAAGVALACTATLVLSPLSWGHYFVMHLPAMVLVPMWLLTRGWTRTAWALSILGALVSLAFYLGMAWLAGWGVLGWGVTVWWGWASVVGVVGGARRGGGGGGGDL